MKQAVCNLSKAKNLISIKIGMNNKLFMPGFILTATVAITQESWNVKRIFRLP